MRTILSQQILFLSFKINVIEKKENITIGFIRISGSETFTNCHQKSSKTKPMVLHHVDGYFSATPIYQISSERYENYYIIRISHYFY